MSTTEKRTDTKKTSARPISALRPVGQPQVSRPIYCMWTASIRIISMSPPHLHEQNILLTKPRTVVQGPFGSEKVLSGPKGPFGPEKPFGPGGWTPALADKFTCQVSFDRKRPLHLNLHLRPVGDAKSWHVCARAVRLLPCKCPPCDYHSQPACGWAVNHPCTRVRVRVLPPRRPRPSLCRRCFSGATI